MTNKINNILLSFLWTIAITLGACFWFNTIFGFNILSGAHWQHLAYMQASQNPVKPAFYISIVCFVLIFLYGLYILIRPGIRTNKTPHKRNNKQTPSTQQTPTAPTPPHPEQTPTQPPVQSVETGQTNLLPYSNAPASAPESETHLTRPPRLNLPLRPAPPSAPPASNIGSAPTNIDTPSVTAPAPVAQPDDWMHLGEIFESAGFTVKKAPNINGLQTSLFAIGTNETVWVGAIGIKTNILDAALNVLRQVFADTLEDIEITVNGFVISGPDAANPEVPQILTFDTPNALRDYMNEHRNPPLPSDDNGNFDAFSSYISTVIEYIEKL